MAVPLASAFVRLRPQADESEFRKAGQKAGAAAGTEVGKGVGKGTTAGLKAGGKDFGGAGATAGKSFADGFTRDSAGRLRQANGRFATDAQKRMLEGGSAAGRGFGNNFNKEGGGIIKRGFTKLKGELGPLLVPLGVGAAVLAIGKIGIQYEDNLNIFRTVTKATGDQMGIVAEKARQLGADVKLPGVSAAGAAAAMTELAKAGFSVQDAMDAAQGTLQLARVAGISEAEASEIAANAVNAFGISAKDTTFVVDELAAAANSSSIEVKEASDSFKMAAAVFSGIQGPAVGGKEAITELNTAVAILGNNGIKGSDAGTSLKQALLQLVAPSERATGLLMDINASAQGVNVTMDQQATILHGSKKERGLAIASIYDHNKALSAEGGLVYDNAGKMRSLREIISRLTAGTKDWSQEDRNLAISQIFGSDATRSILALMKGGVPVYDAQRKAVMESGAAATVAAAKNAGLGGAIDNVKSQFENMAISVYNAVKGPLTTGVTGLANALAPVAGYITTSTEFIGRNINTIRDWAVAIGAVTLALKLNTAVLAIQAAGGLLAYVKGIRIVTTTTRLWSGAQALLNATLLLNPIGLVIIGLTALVAGVILAYRHSETFRKIVQGAFAGIKVAAKATADFFTGTVWPALKAAFDGVAKAALWLWNNGIKPAWDGIMAVVRVAVNIIKVYIQALKIEFNIVATVAMFLWRNVFAPVFAGIAKIVSVWWSIVKAVFGALISFVTGVIFPVIRAIYTNVFVPVFKALRKVVEVWWLAVQIMFRLFVLLITGVLKGALFLLKTIFGGVFDGMKKAVGLWWAAIKVVFGLFRTYILGPFVQSTVALKNAFVRLFAAIAANVSAWWTAHVRPVFNQVRGAWTALSAAFSAIYNSKIKPVFAAFVGFIRTTVVKGFQTGVNAIKAAWDKVKEYARAPVAFVVNHVINPFIGGLNAAAKIVGVKDQVAPIKGFAAGGQVLGYAQGGRIAGTPGLTDNRQAMVSGLGPVQLNGGEYIVNAQDTRKALPLLEWVNRGMSGGMAKARRYIGRDTTRYPGDGSEGYAFKDGGLVGWTKNVWSAITDPVGTIKKPFEAALKGIPGVGMVKNFLVGSAKRLLNGAVKWLTGFGGTDGGTFSYHGPRGGRVGQAASFVQAQAGKPYIWNDAGPMGYDCSGIVSAVYNILKGRSAYSHTFSTGSLPGGFFQPGLASPLIAGWSHPGQSPAGASVGHMAGQIAGLPFESRGSVGVVVGSKARKVGQFGQTGGARLHGGGQVTPQLFDGGGRWPSGVLGMNASGHDEHVLTGGPGGDIDTMTSLLSAILARLGGVGDDVAGALATNSRRGLQRARSMGTQGTARTA